MIFRTKTGSVYEVDEKQKLARRLSGTGTGTERANSHWRAYATADVTLGHPAWITWTEDTNLLEGSPDGAIPATVTSTVVEIGELQ